MKIECKLVPPNQFYKTLNKSIPSKIIKNCFVIDKVFGEGEMQHLELQPGLFINQIDLKLNEPLHLSRKPHEINDYYILNFHLSKSNLIQKTKTKEYQLGFENINILLASACTEADIFIPPHQSVKIFNIGFTQKWLNENILSYRKEKIWDVFLTNEPIYISETINYTYKKNLSLTDLNKQSKLTITSTTLQLLEYFFNKIARRNSIDIETYKGINNTDYTALLKVREGIDNNITGISTIDILSKSAGMSQSKFKRLFKQIFGTTPYQYFLANRMEKSFELIESKKHNVTEVGFIVGYSNPSQFTKAFQNHFGILPSEINF